MLSVRGLTGGYGQTRVLHGIDLEVDQGEIVSILGPNGAGKSTLLRAISGLVTSTATSVTFDGLSLDRKRPDQRAKLGIGHVPEGRGILGRLTVAENLRLGVAAAPSRSVWDEGLERVLSLFPALQGRLSERAASLSGGQQQMLAIGRALIAKPRLLMIDELSFGLAPLITEQILDSIKALREQGQTFLLVEQDASVLRASDRTYVLAGGAVALEERSQNLLSAGRDRLATIYMGQHPNNHR